MAELPGADIFEKIPEIDHREPAPVAQDPAADLAAFRRIVLARRSVRVFEPEPIPDEVVNDCLDLALLAPNSSNLQPWEFHRIREPGLKAEIVKSCFSQPAARTAAELIVCVGRTGTWRENARKMLEQFARTEGKVPKSAVDYYKKLAPLVYNQGPLGSFGVLKRAYLFVQGFRKPVPREPVSQHDMEVWAVKSASLAAENLMLAFRAHGYDTCPMEGYDSSRVHKLLNLSSDAVLVMIVAAGKRSPKGVYGPRIRFDRSRFVIER